MGRLMVTIRVDAKRMNSMRCLITSRIKIFKKAKPALKPKTKQTTLMAQFVTHFLAGQHMQEVLDPCA